MYIRIGICIFMQISSYLYVQMLYIYMFTKRSAFGRRAWVLDNFRPGGFVFTPSGPPGRAGNINLQNEGVLRANRSAQDGER